MERKNHKVKTVRCMQKEKRFYEEQWFWMAITIIVICLTRSVKVITCGNNNSSGLSKE